MTLSAENLIGALGKLHYIIIPNVQTQLHRVCNFYLFGSSDQQNNGSEMVAKFQTLMLLIANAESSGYFPLYVH
jgi:hypothetical protein